METQDFARLRQGVERRRIDGHRFKRADPDKGTSAIVKANCLANESAYGNVYRSGKVECVVKLINAETKKKPITAVFPLQMIDYAYACPTL